MESSCKNNYNVSDAFTALVEMTNLDCTKEKNNNISLNQNKEGNNDDRCC